jgi:bacteriochlorophyll 4-vinyl reductase
MTIRENGVGRVVVASLHQSIGEILPTRLSFYENWLNADGLRDGRIGLAPLYAVLSFLRQEREGYELVMTKAGEYAAMWTVQSMSPMSRSVISALPASIRSQVLLRRAKALVRMSYQGSRVSSQMRHGTARVNVRASVFCSVREPVAQPLCCFYASAFERLLALFDISAAVTVVSCRATGGDVCTLSLTFGAAAVPAEDVEVA